MLNPDDPLMMFIDQQCLLICIPLLLLLVSFVWCTVTINFVRAHIE